MGIQDINQIIMEIRKGIHQIITQTIIILPGQEILIILETMIK